MGFIKGILYYCPRILVKTISAFLPFIREYEKNDFVQDSCFYFGNFDDPFHYQSDIRF